MFLEISLLCFQQEKQREMAFRKKAKGEAKSEEGAGP